MNGAVGFGEAPPPSSARTIPFDYSFRFDLKGRPGAVLTKKVSISVEAAFVAESVGFGVIPDAAPIRFGPTPAEVARAFGGGPAGFLPNANAILMAAPLPAAPPLSFQTLTIGSLLLALDRMATQRGGLAADSLLKGLRLNAEAAKAAITSYDPANPDTFSAAAVQQLFEISEEPPDQVPFLYAFFDEGSGREFQSEPILSTAGLGAANGDRPFRRFARPIRFEPRSEIRMEVTEQAKIRGSLHLALHGYKVLGGSGSPRGRVERAARARARGRT